MPDTTLTTTIRPDIESVLIKREAARMVDVMMGRASPKDRTDHYLMVMRPDRHGIATDALEILSYDYIERLVADACDLETGDHQGRWVGAFTATYCADPVDHSFTAIKLASITMIDNLPELIAAEKRVPAAERLRRHRQRNLVTTGRGR